MHVFTIQYYRIFTPRGLGHTFLNGLFGDDSDIYIFFFLEIKSVLNLSYANFAFITVNDSEQCASLRICV